jgi:hypothetical protein
MEPTSVVTAASNVLKAAGLIRKMADEARQLTLEDVRYYNAWINVASESIKALEQEYIGILIEAAHCQFDLPHKRDELLKRTHEYIHGENLRPSLREAIAQLREGRQALQLHAEQWLIWPNVKKNRQAALARYDQFLNELQGYLGSLGDYGGESAVALNDLREIETLLKGNSPEAFIQKVDDLLMTLDKTTLMYMVTQSAGAIETLRIAFR